MGEGERGTLRVVTAASLVQVRGSRFVLLSNGPSSRLRKSGVYAFNRKAASYLITTLTNGYRRAVSSAFLHRRSWPASLCRLPRAPRRCIRPHWQLWDYRLLRHLQKRLGHPRQSIAPSRKDHAHKGRRKVSHPTPFPSRPERPATSAADYLSIWIHT